jgi:hypothetical protein
MNVILLDMPEDPTDLAGWLERQIAGPHLGALAAELAAFYSAGSAASLDDVLGGDRSAVLASGLPSVSMNVIKRLLRNPGLLLELQDHVLVEGGPYWSTVRLADDHQQAIREQADALRKAIGVEEAESGRAGTAGLQKVEDRLKPELKRSRDRLKPELLRHRPRAKWALWAAMAAAASVTVALLIYARSARIDWGWARPGSIASEASPPAKLSRPDQYLNKLADEANEWFRGSPSSRTELDRRLSQMQAGCDVLLGGLAKANPDWLAERCRAWKTKFDQDRADLAAGADVDMVHKRADDEIRALVAALQKKAAAG